MFPTKEQVCDIRTYFDLCVLVFPQISHIDAESVLFYLFNLRNLCDL